MSINKTNYSVYDILFRAKDVTNSTSDAQLSKIFSINPTTLSSWKSRGIIPYEYMFTLSRAYNISFDWLITGEGRRNQHAINEENTLYSMSEFNQVTLYKGASPGNREVERHNGYDMSRLAFPKEWFIKRHLKQQNLVAVDVIGDSMEPDIPDGSVVLVDVTQKALKNGEVYVFDIDGDLLIKTIIHDFDGYIARGGNATYPDIRLSKDKLDTVNIVGRAVRALPDIKL